MGMLSSPRVKERRLSARLQTKQGRADGHGNPLGATSRKGGWHYSQYRFAPFLLRSQEKSSPALLRLQPASLRQGRFDPQDLKEDSPRPPRHEPDALAQCLPCEWRHTLTRIAGALVLCSTVRNFTPDAEP